MFGDPLAYILWHCYTTSRSRANVVNEWISMWVLFSLTSTLKINYAASSTNTTRPLSAETTCTHKEKQNWEKQHLIHENQSLNTDMQIWKINTIDKDKVCIKSFSSWSFDSATTSLNSTGYLQKIKTWSDQISHKTNYAWKYRKSGIVCCWKIFIVPCCYEN